jgi:hypothetical protein
MSNYKIGFERITKEKQKRNDGISETKKEGMERIFKYTEQIKKRRIKGYKTIYP